MVTFVDSVRFDPMPSRRMPEPVREAREAALGLAGFGILYPVVLGLTVGGETAVTGALRFAPSLLLGLLALGFGAGGSRVRNGALVLAALQILVGVRMLGAADVGVVAVLTVCYAWGASAMLIYLLRQPRAREWFADGQA